MKLSRFLFVSHHRFLLIISLAVYLLSGESECTPDGQLSESDYGLVNNNNNPGGPSIQHLEPCGAVIYNTSNGIIESPGYPDSYPSNVNCEWTVQAEEGQIIQVTFFDVRTQSPAVPFGEAHDYLDVSLTGRVKDTQRYSGDLNAITPFTLLTEGSKLYLRFHSEESHDAAYTGFRLAYYVTNATGPAAFSPANSAIAATCKLDPKDVVSDDTMAAATKSLDDVQTAALREHEAQLNSEFAELEKVNRSNPHPYLVALILEDKQFCSGTLVRNDFVITSAYCTQNVKNIEMIFGTTDTTINDAGVQRRTANASDIIPHPYFDEVTGANDISLIRLNDPVRMSKFVKAVRLPSWSLLGNAFSGVGVKITGWGQHSGGSIASQARSKDLLIAPNSGCRSAMFKGLTGMVMCSKKQPSQRCQADLGSPITSRCESGPIFYEGERDTRKKPSSSNNNGASGPVLAPSDIPVIPPSGGSETEYFPGQDNLKPPNQDSLKPPNQDSLKPPSSGIPGAGQGPPSLINPSPSTCYRQANSLLLKNKQPQSPMNSYRPPIVKGPHGRPNRPRPQRPGGRPRPQRPGGKPRPQRPGGKPRPQRPGGKPRPQRPGKPRPQRPGGKPRPQRPGGKPRPQRPGGKPRPQRPGGKPRPQRPGGKPRPQRPGGKPRPQRPGGKPRPQRPGGKPRPQRPGGKPRPQRPGGKPRPQRPSGKPRPQRPSGKPRPQRPSGKPRPQRPSGKPRPQRPNNKPRPQRPYKPSSNCKSYSRTPNVLLGLVSFGSCDNGFVFTRITAYMDFLSDNMGSWYE